METDGRNVEMRLEGFGGVRIKCVCVCMCAEEGGRLQMEPAAHNV